jgi:hypothetical protein
MKADWCNIPVSVSWQGTGHFRDLRIWLDENVAYGNYDWGGADTKNPDNRVYYFSRHQDATMFALRWL